eukprot:scaffold4407_cov123-Isochrysis_galbana.AAC.8
MSRIAARGGVNEVQAPDVGLQKECSSIVPSSGTPAGPHRSSLQTSIWLEQAHLRQVAVETPAMEVHKVRGRPLDRLPYQKNQSRAGAEQHRRVARRRGRVLAPCVSRARLARPVQARSGGGCEWAVRVWGYGVSVCGSCQRWAYATFRRTTSVASAPPRAHSKRTPHTDRAPQRTDVWSLIGATCTRVGGKHIGMSALVREPRRARVASAHRGTMSLFRAPYGQTDAAACTEKRQSILFW